MKALPLNRRSFLRHGTLACFAVASRLFAGGTQSATPNPTALPPEPWATASDDALNRWRAATRRPVTAGTHPTLRLLASAVRRGEWVRFHYFGGSECGTPREIAPGLLFTADGFDGIYLSGYCPRRRAERTFLVARMQAIKAVET